MKMENTATPTGGGLEGYSERLANVRRNGAAKKKKKSGKKWLWSIPVILVLGFALIRHLHPRQAMEFASISQARSGGTAGNFLRVGGYINYNRIVDVGTTEQGPIEKLLFVEGQHFKKGQPLAILKNREIIVERSIKERLWSEAKTSNARIQNLYKAGAASAAEKEKAENELNRTALDLELASARLDKTIIRAPFDGVIIEKYVEVGALVEGKICRFGDTSDLVAELDVNQNDIQKIRPDQPAVVTLDAFPEIEYAARVLKITPRGDKAKNTVPVKVRILEPDGNFRPNLSAKVFFVAKPVLKNETVKTSLIVPEVALVDAGSQYFVWKKADGKFKRAEVTVGKMTEEGMEVLSGLQADDEVLLHPINYKLQDGMALEAKQPFNIFDVIHGRR